jgi:hypothetical protein
VTEKCWEIRTNPITGNEEVRPIGGGEGGWEIRPNPITGSRDLYPLRGGTQPEWEISRNPITANQEVRRVPDLALEGRLVEPRVTMPATPCSGLRIFQAVSRSGGCLVRHRAPVLVRSMIS